MVTKNGQKSVKNGALGAQRSIFGAPGSISGCVGNAMFFGSLFGRSKIDKNRSLERSGADFSPRPACGAAATRRFGGPGLPGDGQLSKKIEDLMKKTTMREI